MKVLGLKHGSFRFKRIRLSNKERIKVQQRRGQQQVVQSEYGGVLQVIKSAKQGATGLAGLLEAAPPEIYFVYLLCAGVGVPCSEDALVAWVGANIFRGKYSSLQEVSWVLLLVYAGVLLSDILSYLIGLAVKSGVFPFMTKLVFGNKSGSGESNEASGLQSALKAVRKWGVKIGTIQRFSVGFRGPLCVAAGLSGVPFPGFVLGAAIGAVVTMTIQILVGKLLMNSGNVYLSALALVAIPNLVGHIVGPLGTVLGLLFLSRNNKQKPQDTTELKQMSEGPQ